MEAAQKDELMNRVIAHRAWSETLGSFWRGNVAQCITECVRLHDVRAFEIDVRETRDAHFIISHDRRLEGCEICSTDVHAFESGVNFLEDVLRCTDRLSAASHDATGLRLLLNVEIKHVTHTHKLYEMLAEYKHIDIVVTSFHARFLYGGDALCKRGLVLHGLLPCVVPAFVDVLVVDYEMWKHRARQCRALAPHAQLWLYTAQTPDELRACLADRQCSRVVCDQSVFS